MATATAPAPVSRAERQYKTKVLYDRYAGLEIDDRDGGDLTKAERKLRRALAERIAGTARCHLDDAGPLVEEVLDVLRTSIIRRIDEDGLGS